MALFLFDSEEFFFDIAYLLDVVIGKIIVYYIINISVRMAAVLWYLTNDF